jgi:hypothetical protein
VCCGSQEKPISQATSKHPAVAPKKSVVSVKQDVQNREATVAVLINDITRNDKLSPSTLQLAKDGKALQPIVIAASASESTKAVAKELADYLGRMTGATFDVQTGDSTRGIVLGTVSDFPYPALAKALEVREYNGKEAFAIRTRQDKVLLLGATDLGASHAAYRFLEELGVRWFMPN